MNAFRTFFLSLLALMTLTLSGCVNTSPPPDSSPEAPPPAQEMPLDEDQLAKAIDAGIERFIQKQQEEQQKAQQDQKQVADAKSKNVVPLKETDHIRGNKNAEIVLIEYSDFECPFCKRFHPTAKELLKKNPDIAWVYRHFPLGFHDPLATKEAQATECAADQGDSEKFWEMADMIYEKTTSNGRGIKEGQLTEFATTIGLDATMFDACLSTEKYLAHVKQDIAEGSRAGVTGTPGNILLNTKTGETRLIPGAVPLSVLEQAISELST